MHARENALSDFDKMVRGRHLEESKLEWGMLALLARVDSAVVSDRSESEVRLPCWHENPATVYDRHWSSPMQEVTAQGTVFMSSESSTIEAYLIR